jgi:hypothetical protein
VYCSTIHTTGFTRCVVPWNVVLGEHWYDPPTHVQTCPTKNLLRLNWYSCDIHYTAAFVYLRISTWLKPAWSIIMHSTSRNIMIWRIIGGTVLCAPWWLVTHLFFTRYIVFSLCVSIRLPTQIHCRVKICHSHLQQQCWTNKL